MLTLFEIQLEGQAADVTRRYVKSFNGKTRKLRVSSTKGGLEWWNRVLQVFQRGWEMVRISTIVLKYAGPKSY
jgi:xeroderma pigmentosum group C-complementing protein